MTYKEVYDKVLPEHKRKEEKYNLLVSLFLRPISILMTIPFIGTTIKPTTITKVSVVFSLAGFVALSFGKTMDSKLLGWALIFMWVLLDGVDGNLARCTNQCSSLGDLWDTMGGYAALVFINYGLGIAAFYDNNRFNLLENYWYIILGGFSAVFSIFPRLVMHKKKSSEAESNAVKELSDKKSFGIPQIMVMNFISPSGFIQLFILLAVCFHMLNVLVLVYFTLTFMVMIASLYKLLRK